MKLKNKPMKMLLKYLDHLNKEHHSSVKLMHLKCYLRKQYYYDLRKRT